MASLVCSTRLHHPGEHNCAVQQPLFPHTMLGPMHSPYGGDIATLDLQVEFETENRVHLKITAQGQQR